MSICYYNYCETNVKQNSDFFCQNYIFLDYVVFISEGKCENTIIFFALSSIQTTRRVLKTCLPTTDY